MKPRQIVVFDGLRITTEHLDHLQGAFLTGLQDLRETAGLGRVHRGFEVREERAGRVVVQPGLAFDRAGNRIAGDEPMDIDVAFRAGEQALWVTIAYHQSETGETEGRNTLVWDGCVLGLRAEAPGPGDAAIAVARLEPGTNGGLLIHPPEPVLEPTRQPPPTPPEPTPESAPVATRAASGSIRLAVGQGVARMSATAGVGSGGPLRSLAAAVRQQAADVAGFNPSVTLATADIDVPFEPLSLSCQSVLTATFAEGAGEPGAAIHPLSLHAVACSEASPAGAIIAQHAMINVCNESGAFAPVLAEGLVAHLPLEGWAEPATPSGPAVWGHLHLIVLLRRTDTNGLHCALALEWRGGQQEERIQLLESRGYGFHVDAQVAWKALGDLPETNFE